MKLNTNELKRFKANASFIKSNRILPICDYLKFEDGVVTKTSMQSFVQQKINFKGEACLVPEMNLFNFLSRTSEPFIDVYVKDGVCTISDGRQPFVKIPTEKVQNFPSIPVSEEEEFELDNDVMSAINIASVFIEHSDAPDARSFVFIGDGCIAGIGFAMGYKQNFEITLPRIILLKEVAVVVGKLPNCIYRTGERYDFFKTDDTTYGFIKPTYKFFEGLKGIHQVKDEWEWFNVAKEEIISFSDTCVSQSPALGKVASLSMKKDKLNMTMVEPDYNVTVNHAAEAEGNFSAEFNFSPSNMLTMLKTLPSNEIKFYYFGGVLLMKVEDMGIGFIQQIVKN